MNSCTLSVVDFVDTESESQLREVLERITNQEAPDQTNGVENWGEINYGVSGEYFEAVNLFVRKGYPTNHSYVSLTARVKTDQLEKIIAGGGDLRLLKQQIVRLWYTQIGNEIPGLLSSLRSENGASRSYTGETPNCLLFCDFNLEEEIHSAITRNRAIDQQTISAYRTEIARDGIFIDLGVRMQTPTSLVARGDGSEALLVNASGTYFERKTIFPRGAGGYAPHNSQPAEYTFIEMSDSDSFTYAPDTCISSFGAIRRKTIELLFLRAWYHRKERDFERLERELQVLRQDDSLGDSTPSIKGKLDKMYKNETELRNISATLDSRREAHEESWTKVSSSFSVYDVFSISSNRNRESTTGFYELLTAEIPESINEANRYCEELLRDYEQLNERLNSYLNFRISTTNIDLQRAISTLTWVLVFMTAALLAISLWQIVVPPMIDAISVIIRLLLSAAF